MTTCKFPLITRRNHSDEQSFTILVFYFREQMGFQHLAQGSLDLKSLEMVRQGDDESGDRNLKSPDRVQVLTLPKLFAIIHFQSHDSTFILPDRNDDSISDYMLRNVSGI